MPTKIETFLQPFLRKDLPDIKPGDTVKVYQRIKETPKKGKSSTGQEDKERVQAFEGLVIARKHGKGITSTITVRKVIAGIGVERIFPLHLSTIEKIEVLKKGKVRRAKLYYLRKAKGRKARLKRGKLTEEVGLADKVEIRLEKKNKEIKMGETEEPEEKE